MITGLCNGYSLFKKKLFNEPLVLTNVYVIVLFLVIV